MVYSFTRPIRVMIVDDHPLFREGLISTLRLQRDFDVVASADNGSAAVATAAQIQPEIVVLDVNLPKLNGLQAARQIKMQRPSPGVIMLTAYHDTEQVIHALRAGASAYCTKDIEPGELFRVIHAVAAGRFVIDGEDMDAYSAQAWIDTHIEALGSTAIYGGDEHFLPLSPREMEILQYVAHGMANKEIANRLHISQQTVKNHMTSILKKMNVQDRTQAVLTALRHGWVRLQKQQADPFERG
jgi:DNA-binding NarL/FixJ family response regulator